MKLYCICLLITVLSNEFKKIQDKTKIIRKKQKLTISQDLCNNKSKIKCKFLINGC